MKRVRADHPDARGRRLDAPAARSRSELRRTHLMPTAVTRPTGSAGQRVVVVGGGPAGLAAAAALGRRGLPAVVLEQSASLGATWRGAYDRLRLNTSRLTSRLAGEPYPAGAGLFPSRDVFVAYLDRFRGIRGPGSAARHACRAPGARRGRLGPEHVRRRRARRSGHRGDGVCERARPARTAREPSGSRGACSTRPSTETPGRCAAATCWWPAREARAWRSPTTWPRAARRGSGSRCAARRTSCCGQSADCPAISSAWR